MKAKMMMLAMLALVGTAQAVDVVAQLPNPPWHWAQRGDLIGDGDWQAYDQFTEDEYGTLHKSGCVAVAGAGIMEYLRFPKRAFAAGTFSMDRVREVRTETLHWDRLAPSPLDAKGRRTAQTILYNLGGLAQMNYDKASTTPLVNLAGAFRHPSIGAASAYCVDLGANATTADFEATIGASLRCGSPVALSLDGAGAHAVTAYGYRHNDDGTHSVYYALGYSSEPAWGALPKIYGFPYIGYVVTGIVAERPEGVTSSYAVPVLGQVVNEANEPMPFVKVWLTIDGKVVAETATDLQGRYGLWGWFGHDMTVHCSGTDTVGLLDKRNAPLADDAQQRKVGLSGLKDAIEAYTTNFTIAGEPAAIHTTLETAKKKGRDILVLNSEDPDLKEAFRKRTDYTLLYADPRAETPVIPNVTFRPDATFFVLNASGQATGYDLRGDLDAFLANPTKPAAKELSGTAALTEADNGLDVTITGAAAVTVTGNVRLGTLTINAPLTLEGDGTCVWAELKQNAPLTLKGPNLRYVPPVLDKGTASHFPQTITLQEGAELQFAHGDVSGYGYTPTSGNPITLEGGTLCVSKRDTLARPLILNGGIIDIANRASNTYGYGTLDLLGASIQVNGDSTIRALSGAPNASVCLRKSATTITLAADATLTATVPFTLPTESGGRGSLTLTGGGTAAFSKVEAPTTVQSGVLLKGGTYSGGLTLEDGVRLTVDAPITADSVTLNGTVTIEGGKSGVFLTSSTTGLTDSFRVPEGFHVTYDGTAYRLVASYATEPAIYVNGALAEALPDTPERNLLVLTTTDRKESGLWEDYARYRSSAEGGAWNVMIAATGNLAEGQSLADYIKASNCRYVLLGGSATELPPLAGTTDALANHIVGRLPLRDTVAMGTIVDVADAKKDQVMEDKSDEAILQGYVAKLRKAGPTHAAGELFLLGHGYGVPDQYANDTDFTQWDGLPPFSDTEAWYFPTKLGITVYALRDRVRVFREQAALAFPTVRLYDDMTYRLGKAEDEDDFGRSYVNRFDSALLWAEGKASRDALGSLIVGGKSGKITVEAMTALHALVLAPVGQVGAISGETPSVGEMLVLNPQGGALAVIAPPSADATLPISDSGIPTSDTHTVCAKVAEALMGDLTLTVGEALERSRGNIAMNLLGDPTVTICAYTLPVPSAIGSLDLSVELAAELQTIATEVGITGIYDLLGKRADGTDYPAEQVVDALKCFEGLTFTAKDGDLETTFDFGVTAIAIKDGFLEVTVAATAGERPLTFAPNNTYSITPVSLDGTTPQADLTLESVTSNADDTKTLRLSLPDQPTTLFRATVSP